MGHSKTDPGRGKVRVEYLAEGKIVKPIMVGGKMWWADEAGTVRVKKWTDKRVIEIGAKK